MFPALLMKFSYLSLSVNFFLILGFGVFFSSSIEAEYVFYRRVLDKKGVIYENSQEEIYKVLMKYQFPMSIRHSKMLEKELSKEDFSLLIKDENEFIKRMVKAFDDGIEVLYIPQTFYELLFLLFYLEETIKKYECGLIKNSSMVAPKILSKKTFQVPEEMRLLMDDAEDVIFLVRSVSCRIPIFGEVKDKAWQKYDESYKKIYNSTKKAHLKANNWMVVKLESIQAGVSFSSRVVDLILEINAKINELQLLYKKTYKGLLRVDTEIFPNNFEKYCSELMIKALEKAVDYEEKTEPKGKIVIYRGTNGYDGRLDKVVKNNTVAQGLSFGSSLFAGLFLFQGGIAFKIISTHLIGYALALDKTSFLSGTLLERRFFSLKPWPTIVNFMSWGSSFHPRATVSADLRDDEDLAEQLFQKYLCENACLIKNESVFSDQQLLEPFKA
jgi:hypothetical protein